MSRRASGNLFVDRRRGTCGGRWRYRGKRPYLVFGPVEDWPAERAWKRVRAIQRDIDAGLPLPDIERRWKQQARGKKTDASIRPLKDPVGAIFSRIRQSAQIADKFRGETPSRRLQLLADDLIGELHAAEDRAWALVSASYEVPEPSRAGAEVTLTIR